ncbi:hypothetical protein GGR88_000815 [Sphingomonas jejuensis]|uniref:Uncharacterized protein n=1 Tax=Sphingomonas jejuensis TaxID=904715 RepID=A0ABX0XJ33_9SPHN|nr:hypothetical protein [Sphingomonas jejuensis]NJC33341.1 hypothetical protein [Sphingomonas jejuensis]
MSEPQTPKQAAEAAAIRRRWITLGEVLAVVAVVISGLTLWNSYSERSTAAAEKAAERQSEQAAAASIVLSGRVEEDGEAISFSSANEGRVIQSLTVRFPSALGVSPVETLADARLDAGAFARAVRGATDAKRIRLPIAVEAVFTAGGDLHRATGLYQLGLERRDRLIGGDAIRISGVAYQGAAGRAPQAEIDRLWRPTAT